MSNLEFTQPISCYDGAFDSQSQSIIDRQNKALERIRSVYPDAIVTFHPLECEYVVHEWGKELSSYTFTRGNAIQDAINRLFGGSNHAS